MRQAETLASNTLSAFKATINSFQDSVLNDFKHWRRKNMALQSKYENVTLWVRMFTEMNETLKNEFLNAQ